MSAAKYNHTYLHLLQRYYATVVKKQRHTLININPQNLKLWTINKSQFSVFLPRCLFVLVILRTAGILGLNSKWNMSLTRALSSTTVPLAHGLHIPIFGLGTSHNGGYSHEAVVYALTECGVRHIDTAKRYGCEEKLGKAIRESGIPRSDLWITNKLWPGDYGYAAAKTACLDSCSHMGVDYFDLYLMHWPESRPPGRSNRKVRAETWRALEELYKEGVCRSIGVSNFLVNHLEQLLEDCSVVPHVNQVEYHPFQQPHDLMDYCRQKGIVCEGYSPLAKGQVFSNPTVLQIAEKYRRTPSQICIRWSIQNGVVTIPKSTKKNRIKENCEVFDFQLEAADMLALGGLHDGRHVSWDPTNIE